MIKKDLKKYKLPQEPGVYIFRGARKKILYIGKATNLHNRVRSYFAKDLLKSRGPLLVKMLQEAKTLEWEETDSVLEALILEANLIKKHQPVYNTKEKSDKSFNYVVITKEDFPRVLTVRESELLKNQKLKFKSKYTFGPFTQSTVLKEALKIVRKIFPYRDNKCSPACKQGSVKPCFNRQIELCPGVCTREIGKKEYAKTVRNIVLLFQGKKGTLIKKLEMEMRRASMTEDFEQAANLRNKIFVLEHINDTSLIKDELTYAHSAVGERIEAYDVAHMSEQNRVGVMVVLSGGEPVKSEYRKFKIKTKAKGDVAALAEVLKRRFAHSEWPLPNLIVLDGARAQINTAKKVLKEFELKIPAVAVTKDEHHKPKAILGVWKNKWSEKIILLANAEAHRFAINYYRKLKRKDFVGK